MKQNLGKRLILLSRCLAAIFLVAAVFWLHKQESKALRSDVEDLSLLKTIDRVGSASQLRQLPDPVHRHLTAWLGQHHGDVDQKRRELRQALTAWLEIRLHGHQIRDLQGKASAPLSGAIPFQVMQVEGVSDTSEQQSVSSSDSSVPWLDIGPPMFPVIGRSEPNSRTLSEYLDELEELTDPISVIVAVGLKEKLRPWDTGNINGPDSPPIESVPQINSSPPLSVVQPSLSEPNVEVPTDAPTFPPLVEPPLVDPPSLDPPSLDPPFLDPPLLEPPRIESVPGFFPDGPNGFPGDPTFPQGMGMGWKVDGVKMSDGTIVVALSEDLSQSPIQRRPEKDVRSLAITTVRLEAPTLLVLSDPLRPENEALISLSRNDENTDYLRRAYGHLELSQAADLANSGLTQSYQNIGIFGLSLSTRQFPTAVLFFLFLALLGIGATLKTAQRLGLPIIADVSSEDALDLLIDHPIARFIVWVVLPVAAIAASIPLLPLPRWQLITIWIGGILVLALGCFNYYVSLKLRGVSRSDTRSSPG